MNSILTSKWTKVVVFLACLVPLGLLVWEAFHRRAGRESDAISRARHRGLDAAVSGHHAGHYAAAENSSASRN